MDDDQQFCLRWNNHQSTLVAVFDTLLEKGMHVDCTLAAEGQTLKAHKVVLSACSPYFESVLSQQFDKHPIIILKDVKFAELRAMMDYMYRGEVNISQDQLAALLKAAESLQIKGLSDNKPSRPPSRPTQGTAHPPRIPSPTPQTRDSSIDSREGSISPTRRRKKARRMSTEASVPPAMPIPIPIIPVPLPTNDSIQGNGEDTVLKEESQRDGVEDLTIDEDAEDNPAVTHNDVVRNFQWHMERSQDEIMNSSDSIRDSQGELSTAGRLVTRSIKFMDEDELPKATTFAILKNVSSPNRRVVEEMKENKLDPAKDVPKLQPLKLTAPKQPSPKLPAPKVAASKLAAAKGPKIPPPKLTPKPSQADAGPRYNIFHRSDRACPPSQKIKGHKCPNCSRCYTARKNLVRHISLECGRDPQYKCPHCSYSKHRRNELKKHIEKKHPNCTPTDPIQIVRDPGPAKPEPKTKTK